VSDPGFLRDALAANRAGELSAQQRSELEAGVRANLGVLVRVLRRSHPFAKDLAAGRVESIEGALTKSIGSNWDYALASVLTNTPRGNEPTSYRISVANRQLGVQQFRCAEDVYEFAPEAGFVRLFYLPRSRWVVNLERLPDAPVDVSQDGLERSVGDALAGLRGDSVSAVEASAKFAAIGHAVEAYLPEEPPAGGQPARAEELIGTWTSPFLTVTIRQNAKFSARLSDGTDSEGRWSIDAYGRLHADLMGEAIVAEALVEGDELTLVINDQALKLRRTTGG